MQVDQRGTYLAIQLALVGVRSDIALGALSDCFAAVLAFSADTPAEAEQLLDELCPDIKRNIRENWAAGQPARDRRDRTP
jgi:hypothetical protein